MAEEKQKFNQVAYNNAFNAKKYDRVTVMLPKGKQPLVKGHAARRGESTNAFINRAIDETIERDNQTESGEP